MSNSSIEPVQPVAQARVLEAAKSLFARYGFARTSMAEVAREAGVSRPWLYLHFDGKPALFRAMAENLVTTALEGAARAWSAQGGSAEERLAAAIVAKDLPLFRLSRSPHGAELLAVDTALTERFGARLEAEFAALLAERLTREGLDFAKLDGVDAACLLIVRLAAGLKHEMRDEAEYVAALHRLCRMAVRGA